MFSTPFSGDSSTSAAAAAPELGCAPEACEYRDLDVKLEQIHDASSSSSSLAARAGSPSLAQFPSQGALPLTAPSAPLSHNSSAGVGNSSAQLDSKRDVEIMDLLDDSAVQISEEDSTALLDALLENTEVGRKLRMLWTTRSAGNALSSAAHKAAFGKQARRLLHAAKPAQH